MREMYEVCWLDMFVDCPGVPSPVDGLALVDMEGMMRRPQVTVTHVRSGTCLGVFASAEAAARFVLEFVMPLGIDWSLSGRELLEVTSAAQVSVLQDGRDACGGWAGSNTSSEDAAAYGR